MLVVMADGEPDLARGTRLTVGRVNALGPALLSIATPAGQAQRIKMTNETVVVKGAVGSFDDVYAGARVVVKKLPGAMKDAAEVVVLPAESHHGLPGIAVDEDSMTLKNLLGELFTVNTAGAQIDTTRLATIGEITMGSTIFVRARPADSRSLAADEIIVLPDDTAFGS
jgi:hypothetical protein